jgi:hypothetical protein
MQLDTSVLANWPCPAVDGATLYGGTIIGVQLVQVSAPNQTLTFLSDGQWLYQAGATLILSGCSSAAANFGAVAPRLGAGGFHHAR